MERIPGNSLTERLPRDAAYAYGQPDAPARALIFGERRVGAAVNSIR
jgi:hypothetical protein